MGFINKVTKLRYFLLPLTYILVSIGMALLVDVVDRSPGLLPANRIPAILLTRADLAETALSAIATSLLTMTTITFSVIMVVLSTYTSQYTPRTLPNLIQSGIMHHAQGVFFAGFTYSITSLLFLKRSPSDQLVPDAAVGIMLAIVCLVFFIYFIHEVLSFVQVNHLITNVSSNAEKTIHALSPADKSHQPHGPKLQEQDSIMVHASKSGYIRYIDHKLIMRYAEREDLYIRLIPRIGQYVYRGKPLLKVWGGAGLNQEKLKKAIDLGRDRTNQQDVEYIMEKIVETALRAISPGINDPNTAIYCIRELSRILHLLGERKDTNWLLTDSHGKVRLEIPFPKFKDLLYKTFYQIRHYGAKDISVSTAILKGLSSTASGQREEIKRDIAEFAPYITHNIKESSLHKLDQDYLDRILKELSESINGSTISSSAH